MMSISGTLEAEAEEVVGEQVQKEFIRILKSSRSQRVKKNAHKSRFFATCEVFLFRQSSQSTERLQRDNLI